MTHLGRRYPARRSGDHSRRSPRCWPIAGCNGRIYADTDPYRGRGSRATPTRTAEILEVQLRQNWGWNAIGPLFGTLRTSFQETGADAYGDRRRRAATSTCPGGSNSTAQPGSSASWASSLPSAWKAACPRSSRGELWRQSRQRGSSSPARRSSAGVQPPAPASRSATAMARQGNGEVSSAPVATALAGTVPPERSKKKTGLAQPFEGERRPISSPWASTRISTTRLGRRCAR